MKRISLEKYMKLILYIAHKDALLTINNVSIDYSVTQISFLNIHINPDYSSHHHFMAHMTQKKYPYKFTFKDPRLFQWRIDH